MLIVGELINSSRKEIKEIVNNRDGAAIQRIAKAQVDAGANYIDINCGTQVFDELEVMKWLVDNVQEAVNVPLCIDSPSPEAVEVGLKLAKYGQPMINSITAEKERFEKILPLVLEYKAKIVGLCISDKGIPESAQDRFDVATKLIKDLIAAGVPQDDIYIDPLVKPISAAEKAGLEVIQTLRLITEEFPGVHKICGLSNISYGLPNRKMLNRLFMVLTLDNGMDSYILNPLDKTMMGFLHAATALVGKDKFCMNYLSAHRKGLYEVLE